MDGDLQHPPERIKFLSKKFLKNEADVVVGSRIISQKRSWFRFIKIFKFDIYNLFN